MAGERTESATPRRRQEARAKGQVAKSMDLNVAVVLLAALVIMMMTGSGFFQQLSALVRASLSDIPHREITQPEVAALGGTLLMATVPIVLPIMIGLMVAAGIVAVGQVGFLIALKGLVDFGRMNPITGAKRLVGLQALVEFAKSMIKIVVIGAVAYRGFEANLPKLVSLTGATPSAGLARVSGIALEIGLQCALAFIILAALDYGFQRWQYERSLRMTKQEVKEEQKQQEGNPEIKARIRRLQREMARGRMMAKVPTATVVITNPTHYAVALRYNALTDEAPVVVAKGLDLIALEIKRIATDFDVPIVENKPLARALYAAADLDRAIPVDLYHAVAEVLAYIYRLRGQAA